MVVATPWGGLLGTSVWIQQPMRMMMMTAQMIITSAAIFWRLCQAKSYSLNISLFKLRENLETVRSMSSLTGRRCSSRFRRMKWQAEITRRDSPRHSKGQYASWKLNSVCFPWSHFPPAISRGNTAHFSPVYSTLMKTDKIPMMTLAAPTSHISWKPGQKDCFPPEQ